MSQEKMSQVQVQVQLMTGLDLEGQVQVRKKSLGPGPDRTLDSLAKPKPGLLGQANHYKRCAPL